MPTEFLNFMSTFYRWMYISDWGADPKIERCSMNGDKTSCTVLVNSNIVWPNDIAIGK